MTIRSRIQAWLGIDSVVSEIVECQDSLESIERKVNQIATAQLGVILPGLGRIIAKIDPAYIGPEDDPKRKAESDRLGEEAIKRMIGEQQARDKHRWP